MAPTRGPEGPAPSVSALLRGCSTSAWFYTYLTHRPLTCPRVHLDPWHHLPHTTGAHLSCWSEAGTGTVACPGQEPRPPREGQRPLQHICAEAASHLVSHLYFTPSPRVLICHVLRLYLYFSVICLDTEEERSFHALIRPVAFT